MSEYFNHKTSSQKVCQIFDKIERSNHCNLENNHGIGLIFSGYILQIIFYQNSQVCHVQYIEGSS